MSSSRSRSLAERTMKSGCGGGDEPSVVGTVVVSKNTNVGYTEAGHGGDERWIKPQYNSATEYSGMHKQADINE